MPVEEYVRHSWVNSYCVIQLMMNLLKMYKLHDCGKSGIGTGGFEMHVFQLKHPLSMKSVFSIWKWRSKNKTWKTQFFRYNIIKVAGSDPRRFRFSSKQISDCSWFFTISWYNISDHKQEVSSMPVLSRFYGIIIRMYFQQAEHNPPHIHALYG